MDGNILYHNNGDGTFTDVSKKAGLSLRDGRRAPVWSVSGVWFDYNGDGQLDVFVANYLEYDGGKFRNYYHGAGYPGPLSYTGTAGISVPQQRRRHVHRRDQGSRRLQPGRPRR